MRRVTFAILLLGALIAAALWLKPWSRVPAPPVAEERGHGGEEALPDTATIRGTVTKPDGPIWILPVRAIVGEDIVAEVGTDPNGRYRIEVPAGKEIRLEFDPDPAIALKPVTCRFRLAAGAEIVQDVKLETWPSASGRVEGLPLGESVILLAIRDEDFPVLPQDPLLAAAALDAVPSVRASAFGSFRFKRLDAGVTYRLAAYGLVWAVRDVVRFKAGDDAIVAKVDLVVPVSVWATDLETGAPLPVFTVKLVGYSGVLATISGRMGRAERSPLPPVEGRPPGAEQRLRGGVAEFLGRCTFVVNAEAYHEQSFRPLETGIALQAVREPNVILPVVHPDGGPCEGDLTGRFGDGGRYTLHVRREAPGRFLASLPAGRWHVRIARTGVLFDAEPEFDVVVPSTGTVELPPIVLERTGTVTFAGSDRFTLQRLGDGQWKYKTCDAGKHDLPVGSYRVVTYGSTGRAFEVAAGGADTVKLPR